MCCQILYYPVHEYCPCSSLGVIIGIILRYGINGSEHREFYLAEVRDNCSNASDSFEVGETIQINTLKDNFTCSVSGKVFQDEEGAPIRTTVGGRLGGSGVL